MGEPPISKSAIILPNLRLSIHEIEKVLIRWPNAHIEKDENADSKSAKILPPEGGLRPNLLSSIILGQLIRDNS